MICNIDFYDLQHRETSDLEEQVKTLKSHHEEASGRATELEQEVAALTEELRMVREDFETRWKDKQCLADQNNQTLMGRLRTSEDDAEEKVVIATLQEELRKAKADASYSPDCLIVVPQTYFENVQRSASSYELKRRVDAICARCFA